jgi:hypothetical protein
MLERQGEAWNIRFVLYSFVSDDLSVCSSGKEEAFCHILLDTFVY